MNHFSFELSLIAVLPALILCAFVFYKDRIEKEPFGLLTLLFGAGAVAYVPSTMLEKCILDLLSKGFEDSMRVSAEGFVQFTDSKSELTYLALCAFLGFSLVRVCIQWGILFLVTYKNKNFNHLFDGIVYSVFLSLGFAVAENLHFLMRNDVEFLLPKLITSVPCQLFIGVIMGYFYTMGHMRFAANEIEEKLLNSDMIQKDNIRTSAPWLISGILIPCIISGIYHLAGSAKDDWFTTVFYTLVFLTFGISFFAINQIASKDVSYGKYLHRIIAKAHPELSPDTINKVAKMDLAAKREGQE